MWALPSLSALHPDHIIGDLDSRSLWCLLLFPKADKSILRALDHNWDLFDKALGRNAHVITLLEREEAGPTPRLKFPQDYEKSVGEFCNRLEIRHDELPALILLNAVNESQQAPYWHFVNSPMGSEELKRIIADVCEATFGIDHSLDPTAWRKAATSKLSKIQVRHAAIKVVKTLNIKKYIPDLIKAVRSGLAI